MDLKDMFFGALALCDKDGYPYDVSISAIVDENVDIPNNIRKMYPENITLAISSGPMSRQRNHDMHYDYDKQTLSFNVSFSGLPYYVTIPSKNVMVVIDNNDGSFVGFGSNQPFQPNRDAQDAQNTKDAQQKKQTKKPVFTVVK